MKPTSLKLRRTGKLLFLTLISVGFASADVNQADQYQSDLEESLQGLKNFDWLQQLKKSSYNKNETQGLNSLLQFLYYKTKAVGLYKMMKQERDIDTPEAQEYQKEMRYRIEMEYKEADQLARQAKQAAEQAWETAGDVAKQAEGHSQLEMMNSQTKHMMKLQSLTPDEVKEGWQTSYEEAKAVYENYYTTLYNYLKENHSDMAQDLLKVQCLPAADEITLSLEKLNLGPCSF